MKKILLYSLVVVSVFSCYKLEENDKRYTKKKLLKMLDGRWELVAYDIDGISYLDTFLKVNKDWNCKIYDIHPYMNYFEKKADSYNSDGSFEGDCQKNPSKGFDISALKKTIGFDGLFFRDSIFFFGDSRSDIFDIRKIENNDFIIENESNNHKRRLSFIKK